jgi:hypothetical protein
MTRYLLAPYSLKAWLESRHDLRHALEIVVVNCGASAGLDFIEKRIAAARPAVLCLSCYSWNIDKVASLLERNASGVPSILGGPEMSARTARELAARGLGDYYVFGEGELPLEALARHLALGEGPFPEGVGRREGLGLTGSQALATAPVAALPSAYLAGAVPEAMYARQQAYVETQRGCRYRCAYCVYHRGRKGIEYRNMAVVQAELRHLIVTHKVKALRFIDAIFTSDLERAKNIIRLLLDLRAECELPWIYWEFSYSSVDDEFMTLLAQLRTGGSFPNNEHVAPADRPQEYSDLLAGYTVINCLGLQSLNPASLKAVGRPAVSMRAFDRFMRAAAQHGVALKIDLILGLPHESRGSFFSGLDTLLPYLEGTDHILNVHRLQLLPGSRLEEIACPLGLAFDTTLPHNINATPELAQADIEELSKLTGLLFRALNSPLRKDFYAAYKRHGGMAERLLGALLEAAAADPEVGRCGLFTRASMDDVYWNGAAFRDIPSAWLAGVLARVSGATAPATQPPRAEETHGTQ